LAVVDKFGNNGPFLIGTSSAFWTACGPTSPWHPCREGLHPFNPEARPKEGGGFRRQPFGCPITHFARVLKNQQGIVTVHLVGPVHLLHGLLAPEDIGICTGRPPSRGR